MQLNAPAHHLDQSNAGVGLRESLGAEQSGLGEPGLEFLHRDTLGHGPDLGDKFLVSVGPGFGAGSGAIRSAALVGIRGKEQVHGDIALLGEDDGGLGLDFPETLLRPLDPLVIEQIDFVQDDQVGAGDLVGKGALQIPAFGQLLGVGHHHRHIVPDPATDGFAPEIQLGVEGERDPRGFDHHAIGPDLLAQPLERVQKIIREFAADAAALDLDVGVSPASQQGPVDAQGPEFVGNQGHPNAGSHGLVQESPDQGRLARPQEARNDQGRDLSLGLLFGTLAHRAQRIEHSERGVIRGAIWMADYDYDLFVIGAGSGGVRASRLAASFGARVAVAEERFLGGTCVNVGCIPKKLLVYASAFREELGEAEEGYGWSVGEPAFDWPRLIENKNREIARLNGVYQGLLDGSGVESIEGRATVTGPNEVSIEGRTASARHILVATGSRAFRPPEIEGVEHAITSDEAFYLDALPERAVIVGGGYIAVEFAGIFRGMGADVSQLYRGPLFLRGFDDDLRKHLAGEMRARGIDLRFDSVPTRIEAGAGGVRATLNDGSQLEADQLLCATGRHPNSADLGLEAVGVECASGGAVVVDEYSRTTVPSIHAIGDVTDRINLTPVAIHEAICLANTLFNDRPMAPSHEAVPAAVFSQPPLGTVGLSEAEARASFSEVDIYRSVFRGLKQTLTASETRCLMKLVVDRASDRVLGLHMAGHEAGEIVQGFAVAVRAGLTKAQFDDTLPIHPTLAEEFVTLREPVTGS